MVKNYFLAVRYQNLLIIFFLFWGLIFNYNHVDSSLNLDILLLSFSIIFTASSGYLINNLHDIKSDITNHKNQYGFTKRYYLTTYLINVACSFIFLFLSDLSGAWIQLVFYCHLLVISYSILLQHIPLLGNLAVALLCGIVLYIPSVIHREFYFETSFNLNESVVELYVVFCVLFTMARELIKDMEDISGDLTVQSKTFPIVFGINPTKGLIALIFISSTLLLSLGLFRTSFSISSFSFFIPSLVISFVLLLSTLNARETSSFQKLSKLIKLQFLFSTLWLYVNALL
tara:strand:- start:1539 stop:2399 length:861 start_codon:yes stop_codon:yes gene_type:complete